MWSFDLKSKSIQNCFDKMNLRSDHDFCRTGRWISFILSRGGNAMGFKRLTLKAFLVVLYYLVGSGVSAPLALGGFLTVDATANIFGAGHSTAPNPGGGSGGILPPEFSLSPGSAQALTVTSVTGTVSLTPGYPSNGSGNTGFATNISSYDGISGIVDPNRSGFLVGVFLSNTEPSDPAPPVLTFSDSNTFTTLSPLLDQTFLIGIGQTTGGVVQTFYAPTGATRLFLGFADANGYQGLPGQYQDNSGSLGVTFSVLSTVPEPTSASLLASGVLGLLTFGRLRRAFQHSRSNGPQTPMIRQ
jgi:hypothetical protein